MLRSSLAPLLCGVAAALALAGAAGAQAFTQPAVAQYHGAVAPALCRVEYTAVITNPATGETQRRDNRAVGLIVSPDGLVMTHGHMKLEQTEPVSIRVVVGEGDGETPYTAELLEKPEDVNVAFLRIDADAGTLQDLPYVRFARSPRMSLGEPVLILGLLGENLDFARSSIRRYIGTILEQPRTTYVIDESLPFGYVGGPVIDTGGRVVGVVGYDLSRAEGGELYIRSGHPLVYHAPLFAGYIADPPLPAGEAEARGEDDGWLGILTQPLTDDLAAYWDLPPRGGVVIATVVRNSPASEAGLLRGDVITRFNGVPVRPTQDRDILLFTKLVRETGAGTEVDIEYLRDGDPLTTSLTLGTLPTPAREADTYEDEVFGMTVREITTDIRLTLNIGQDVEGVIVQRVESGSWANIAGVRPGVIILNVGGQPVASVEDYREAVEAAAEEQPEDIALFCRVGPRTGFFRLQPRWDDGDAAADE